MKKIPTIEQVMTPFPHTVGLDQPLEVARELMREYGVRHLPVQSGGKLVGIISDRDVKFAVACGKDLDVEDIYTPEPYVVDPSTKLDVVAHQMSQEKIGCALVVKNEKLIGLFTTVDACRELSVLLRA